MQNTPFLSPCPGLESWKDSTNQRPPLFFLGVLQCMHFPIGDSYYLRFLRFPISFVLCSVRLVLGSWFFQSTSVPCENRHHLRIDTIREDRHVPSRGTHEQKSGLEEKEEEDEKCVPCAAELSPDSHLGHFQGDRRNVLPFCYHQNISSRALSADHRTIKITYS